MHESTRMVVVDCTIGYIVGCDDMESMETFTTTSTSIDCHDECHSTSSTTIQCQCQSIIILLQRIDVVTIVGIDVCKRYYRRIDTFHIVCTSASSIDSTYCTGDIILLFILLWRCDECIVKDGIVG